MTFDPNLFFHLNFSGTQKIMASDNVIVKKEVGEDMPLETIISEPPEADPLAIELPPTKTVPYVDLAEVQVGRRSNNKNNSSSSAQKKIDAANEVTCQRCNKSMASINGLISHIGKSDKCLRFYGNDGIEELRKLAGDAAGVGVERARNLVDNMAASSYSGDQGQTTSNGVAPVLKKMDPEDVKMNFADNFIRPCYVPDDCNSVCCKLPANEGLSKLNCDAEDDEDDDDSSPLETMPDGTYLLSKQMPYNFHEKVDSIVGMTLSNDGESIEVRPLMSEETISVDNLRTLFHSIMAVLNLDICQVKQTENKRAIASFQQAFALFQITHYKNSPFFLNPTENTVVVLRNKFTKELMEAGERMPNPPAMACEPDTTRETHFLSEEMTDAVPSDQLLVNRNLQPRDMAAVGVLMERAAAEDGDRRELRPLFAVNMNDDWMTHMRTFTQILLNWFGSKDRLNSVFKQLPCYTSATNKFVYEVYEDCLRHMRGPKTVMACRYCGVEFQFNSYLFSEKNKFKHHESTHDKQCNVCDAQFDSIAGKKFHMRLHKNVNFPCPYGGKCIFVGSSQKSLDSHIKYKHVEAMCEICGKNFSSGATLDIHVKQVHQKIKPKKSDEKFFCHICGKSYARKTVLRKHIRSHSNKKSTINKLMFDDPKMYKFKCTKHDNCKKYFKKARYLKRHLETYASRPFPDNPHPQFMPVIPPDQKFITDEDPEFWAQAEREERAKSRLEKIQANAPAQRFVQPHKGAVPLAFPCHLCSKSYERKATLEKHLAGHSRGDSIINRVMGEDPTEYKYMCTRHPNCKRYFKKARYLKNHLYKFAKIPYPEHVSSHYMPDIPPGQKFITDQDPELWDHIASEEKVRRESDKAKRISRKKAREGGDDDNAGETNQQPEVQPPPQAVSPGAESDVSSISAVPGNPSGLQHQSMQQQQQPHQLHRQERPMSISSMSSEEDHQRAYDYSMRMHFLSAHNHPS